jgi:hypothetical protein
VPAGRPLRLTDAQLVTVMDRAGLLPRAWRTRFLEALTDELLPIGSDVTDREVSHAIDRTLRNMGVAA